MCMGEQHLRVPVDGTRIVLDHIAIVLVICVVEDMQHGGTGPVVKSPRPRERGSESLLEHREVRDGFGDTCIHLYAYVRGLRVEGEANALESFRAVLSVDRSQQRGRFLRIGNALADEIGLDRLLDVLARLAVRLTWLGDRCKQALGAIDDPPSQPVECLVDRRPNLLDDTHDLVGHLAEPGEAGEEADRQAQEVRQRAFDLLGRAVDGARGDRGDRVDEAGDDLDDLRDLLDEDHDRVVDLHDRCDEPRAGDEQRDELRDRLLDDGVDDEVGDPADHHVLEVGELLLDRLPGGGGSLADELDDDVETGLERLDGGLADSLDELAADVLQGHPEHREHELEDLLERERLRYIDAGQRPGEPIDQPGFEVLEEVRGEVLESELRGADEIPDEADRRADDLLEGAGGLAHVLHRAGRDDLEDDLQQAQHLVAGPG